MKHNNQTGKLNTPIKVLVATSISALKRMAKNSVIFFRRPAVQVFAGEVEI